MKPPPFEYARPSSVDEALELLAADEDTKVLAGGQSLIPVLNFRLARPSTLIDISRVGLDGVRGEVVGATTTQWEWETSPECPPLVREALAHVGHLATRCRGTVGGSLAHADPSAELPVCAVALGAELTLQSVRGSRVVAAADFFRGVFETALEPGEIVTSVRWPAARGGVAFEEYAHRHGDFAVVCVAVAGDRVVVGGVAPTPVFYDESLEPIGTDDAPVEYKRELVRVLVERARKRAAA